MCVESGARDNGNDDDSMAKPQRSLPLRSFVVTLVGLPSDTTEEGREKVHAVH